MKLLVTGTTGFTGRHFVSIAESFGHEVVALQACLEHRDDVMCEVKKVAPEAVVHLAGISFVGEANPSLLYNVNVIGTLNLLDALTSLVNPPQRVLLVSSANVYGNSGKTPIIEDTPPAPVNHYAMSKLAMEHMARTYLNKLALFFVRPFNYIGPGQSESFVIPKLVTHFIRRADTIELGNCDVEREFNDVRFVCEAYCRLLEKGQPGDIYNICSGKPVALKSVIELLSQLTGHHLDIKVNPTFVRKNEIHRLCGSPKKLVDLLGEMDMAPLKDTLNWMLEQAPKRLCI